MTAMQKMSEGFWRWLDRVAEAMAALVARLAAPRTISLVEGDSGDFTAQSSNISMPTAASERRLRVDGGKILGVGSANVETALRGSHVELVLQPERFLFKPLELPLRAAEFLDGIVRAQIDRLTPWTAEHVAFGCSKPADAGTGRIVITVAATAKSTLAPYLRAFAGQGIRSIAISTRSPEAAPNAPVIRILEENVAGMGVHRARRILLATLAAGCLLTATAVAAATVVGGHLQARQDELARRILERRSAVIAARNTAVDPAAAAERELARRKNETPASVIVLEVLSQILPDHTYVTELRIEGDKLRLTGVTRDAPSLIGLIEQSPHFTSATFFAPTTRAPSDSGDRFNIEARIKPVFSPRS
jgi:general secretion pathway protein L